MITNPRQTSSVNSTTKSPPVATASVASANAAKPQKAVPSHEMIAQRAYAIWLSQGQKPGCDQQNWLEAEMQLRHP